MLPGARPVRNSTTMVSSSHDQRLTEALAVQVMGWRVGPDRFITGARSWLPKWRFNPLQQLLDAFMLLDYSKSKRYVISKNGTSFQVEVEHDGKVGKATGKSKPRTITLALARSLGLDVQSVSQAEGTR